MALLPALLAACATSHPPTPRVLPPRGTMGAGTTSDSPIVRTAMFYLGSPYVLGGISPAGFDCSGFVWFVFRQNGIDLPRTVSSLAGAGHHIDRGDLRAGDLVFFNTTGEGFTHVGIVVGPDAFIHAPNSRGVVRVESLSSSYWSPRYLGARRITP